MPQNQPVQNVPAQVQAAGNAADQLLQSGQPGGEVPPGPGQQPAGDNWKHKYDVLQGKYNAEMPQLQQTNSYLTSELLTMKTLVHDLQQQLSGLQAKPNTPAAPASLNLGEFLNDDQKKKLDEEGLSSEVLNMLGQAISGVTTQQLDTQAAGFQQDIQTLRGDQAKTAEANFWTVFEGAIPDFKALNANPVFKEFMNVPVVGTGKTRQELANDALRNLDSHSVIAIYNEFKTSQPPAGQQSQFTPGQQPQLTPGQQPPPGGLVGQVDPIATLNVQGQPPVTVTDTRIYTKAEVNKFFRDVAIGNYKNNPEQAQQLESLLLAACQEGRVEGSLQPTR